MPIPGPTIPVKHVEPWNLGRIFRIEPKQQTKKERCNELH